MKKQVIADIVFWLIAALHLYSIYAHKIDLQTWTKPLICPSLLLLLFFETGLKGKFNKLIGLGLVFGWMGDVFLMLQDAFVLGLAAFLIGHVLYIYAFLLQTKPQNLTRHKGYLLPTGLLATYGFYFFGVLKPSLGILEIPVILYIVAISAMVIFAFTRRTQTNLASFLAAFFGAILFVVSDSFLAINKFVAYMPNASLLIMSTYILAQYGITLGAILHEKRKNKQLPAH